MAFELPSLPYEKSALEPHMSTKTIEIHYGKHHQGYVTNLNNLVKNTPFASMALEAIIRQTTKGDSAAAIFNNAAKVWNHSFFWNSIKPAGGGAPVGDLAQRFNRDFGSFEKLEELFGETAVAQFGSGWVWLVVDMRKLRVMKRSNAMTPLIQEQLPLLTYLDYQNRRSDFVRTFLDRLVNWEFAAMTLGAADRSVLDDRGRSSIARSASTTAKSSPPHP